MKEDVSSGLKAIVDELENEKRRLNEISFNPTLKCFEESLNIMIARLETPQVITQRNIFNLERFMNFKKIKFSKTNCLIHPKEFCESICRGLDCKEKSIGICQLCPSGGYHKDCRALVLKSAEKAANVALT